MEVKFFPRCPVPECEIAYAVIVARYRDQWILCRHKQRTTWEIPGGHREATETPEETARRELWEETGAIAAEIQSVGYYSASRFGQLFYADIQKLGAIPENSEIAEISLEDKLPDNLTYPDIQPLLFRWVQNWLNMQTGAGELWDVYDAQRNLTGRFHPRGQYLAEGDYHLVVHIWMQNQEGKFLITKRSPNKGYPNTWETTGGSALAGDDSLTAALREVQEETGLSLDPKKGERVITYRGTDYFADVWLFRQDFDLRDVVLLEGETCDVMYASADEIRELDKKELFVPYRYLDDFLKQFGY